MIPRLHKHNIRHLYQLHCSANSTIARSSSWKPVSSLVQTSRLSDRARDRSLEFISTSSSLSSSNPNLHHGTTAVPGNRTFATAVNEPEGATGSPFPQSPSLSNPMDPSSPSIVIMKEAFEDDAKHVRRFNGIGGYQDEMVSNLDACLSSGMFERAEHILARLVPMYTPNSPELKDLYQRCLERMVSYMIYYRQHSMLAHIQKWFEQKETQGLISDPSSYALMLKMSLQMLVGFRRERTVKRYWEKAKDAELDEAVLASGVLTTSELGVLSEVKKKQQLLSVPHLVDLPCTDRIAFVGMSIRFQRARSRKPFRRAAETGENERELAQQRT